MRFYRFGTNSGLFFRSWPTLCKASWWPWLGFPALGPCRICYHVIIDFSILAASPIDFCASTLNAWGIHFWRMIFKSLQTVTLICHFGMALMAASRHPWFLFRQTCGLFQGWDKKPACMQVGLVKRMLKDVRPLREVNRMLSNWGVAMPCF